MKTIYKYQLKGEEWQFVTMPEGAQILCVQSQRDMACLWAIVDTEQPLMQMRKIHIYGTGHEIPDTLNLVYIGTFQVHSGALVFHVFEAVQ